MRKIDMREIKATTSMHPPSATTVTKTYHCEKCKDETYINIEKEGHIFARECECREANMIRRKMKNSGLKDALDEKHFDSFVTDGKPKMLQDAKDLAIKYVKDFKINDRKKNHSLLFLGAVGSGKSHLSIAVANALMQKNIGVHYFSYREGVMELKQNVMNGIYYLKKMETYKNTTVLFIDDLFKGRITESDTNICFEIINHRYIHKKPMIISSEYGINKLLDIDEAIASRLIEMARGQIIEFRGERMNHRLMVSKRKN